METLRREITRIDRQILELALRRIECARAIGHVKVGEGLPVRDYTTERVVLERTREICEELGLSVELGEGLLAALMEEAIRVQEELREQAVSAQRLHALVVGGSGGMGRWLCRYLEAQGHGVAILDPAPGPDDYPRVASLEAGWSEADVAVLAVPLHVGPALYDEVLALPPGPLVFDVFSLKSHVAGRIREAVRRGHCAASVHPMFGPDARLLSGRALVHCDTGHPEATRRVQELFAATSLHLVELPLEEHDRRMADVLGLSHAMNLAFSRALLDSGPDPGELLEVASTTYLKQIRTAAEVVSENPALYFDIQRQNPHTLEVLERLARAVESLRQDVSEGKLDAFTRWMERGRKFFATGDDPGPPAGGR